ncbi:MAG: hypothetical protein AB8G15_11330, partial [Saprospiraceae bacterium]
MKKLISNIILLTAGKLINPLRLVFASLLLLGVSNQALAQCQMSCNLGTIQISLDQNCQAQILPDMMLEGDADPACGPYTVDVNNTGSDLVNSSYIGQTVQVSVSNAFGNSCWGTILVEDKLAPSIDCSPISITCLDPILPFFTGFPTASDNCDPSLDRSYTDAVQDLGCNNGGPEKIITRTWTVTDDSGNSASCDQIITVTRPALSDVVFPLNRDDIQLPALNCVNPNTDPSNTGVPTIFGYSIDGVCHFDINYTDTQIDVCENSYKILREWKVIDWCTSTSVTMEQTIKVLDKDGPAISPVADVTISTNVNTCTASYILPVPVISDNCTANPTYTAAADQGTIIGNALFNLPLGQTTVTYTAIDDCGNESTDVFIITVEDQIAPVAVCDINTTINLTSVQPTLAFAANFDSGSYDDCSDVTLQVRRMNMPHCPGNDGTPFGPTVPFYCCDVGNTVTVALLVTDAAGNQNTCMVQAFVDDKLNPSIACPADVTLDCGQDPLDLALTGGEAVGTDNCSAIVTNVITGSLDNCGEGTITRIWTATDPGGRTASCL